MYFKLLIQNKFDKKIINWNGSISYKDSPSKSLANFYQHMDGYEYPDWIATNLTEDQFNWFYGEGQRIFWLEDYNSWMLLEIDDKSDFTEVCRKRFNLDLIYDLTNYCYDYLDGNIDRINFVKCLEFYVKFSFIRASRRRQRNSIIQNY
jgi:hypothetical protein